MFNTMTLYRKIRILDMAYFSYNTSLVITELQEVLDRKSLSGYLRTKTQRDYDVQFVIKQLFLKLDYKKK